MGEVTRYQMLIDGAWVDAEGGKTFNEKMSIGEHGFVAHFEDSEGNCVALHSMT